MMMTMIVVLRSEMTMGLGKNWETMFTCQTISIFFCVKKACTMQCKDINPYGISQQIANQSKNTVMNIVTVPVLWLGSSPIQGVEGIRVKLAFVSFY